MNTRRNNFIKRKISFLLAFVIAFSSSMCDVNFNIKAEEQREPFGIYINDQYAASENQLTFDYGVTLSPEVSGTTTALIMWMSETDYNAGSTDWKDWSMLPEQPMPGKYYIGFNDFDKNYKLENGDRFSFIIQPAKLDTPSNLLWNGLTVSWDAVNTASVTGALASNADSDAVIDEGSMGGYTVSLYKDNVEKYNTTVTSASIDLSEKITSLGYGDYTVMVVANSADTSKYTDSDAAQRNKTYKDEINPVILSFSAGEGENSGKLIANVIDAQTGITGYAFTTKADASELSDSDWTIVDAATQTQIYTYEPTETGVYYFYAKDTEGNIAKSDALNVTIIRYNDYYDNGTKKTKLQALIGDKGVTLDTGMSRPGYVLEGWYEDSEFTGETLTEVTSESHLESGFIDVYAKWEKAGVVFTQNLSDKKFTYDGQTRILEVVLDDSVNKYVEEAKDGSISYQWYKKQGDSWTVISGATASGMEIKNVADSGLYYVEVTIRLTDEQDGQVEDKYRSNTANIKITPVELTLNVDSVNIDYLDDIPDYTASIEGNYVAEEDKDIAGIVVDYSCDYEKGSAIGSYTITATATSDYNNYRINCNSGTLIVHAKNVTDTDSGVTVKLTDSNVKYTYDGIEHKPGITVEDSNIVEQAHTVDSSQYDIEYLDCVAAGVATAKITFKNNYAGSKTVEYRIDKADFKPEVSMEGWTFGDAPNTPVVTSNLSGGEKTFYYYKKGENASQATTDVPVNAGEYFVYVKVGETPNYNAGDSLVDGNGIEFTISKKVITITTQSGAWVYDGNTHVAPGYDVLGKFVGTDGFKNIVITGSIVDVGTCENSVEYTLTSSTLADNYDIRKELGTLAISSAKLAAPANPSWDSDHPGRATWVAVTRDNLVVSYRVQLYRVADSGYEPVGESMESNTTFIDYLDIIKNDCKVQNGSQSYVFDVIAIPSGGDSKKNYTESNATIKSAQIGTVLVGVGKDSGIDSVTINGESGPIYLVRDETATIESVTKTGYAYADTVWTTTSPYFTIANNKSGNTSIKVGNIPNEKGLAAQFVANSVDKIPVITDFSATPIDNNSKVLFSFGANDELNITGWMINQSAIAPDANAEGWVNVDSTSVMVNTDEGNNVVSEEGSYYLWVKDSNGSVVGTGTPINVYRIKFANGGGTGSMSDILKVQNINVTLPELTYERAGYYFKNWSGSTGIYVNGGIYAANKDDTLTATWTDQAVSYKVQYYYMNTDGTYNEVCESVVDFNAYYGEIIKADSVVIQAARAGFELDTDKFLEKNGAVDIKICESDTIVKLYYKRKTYKLTFSYIIPKSGETVSFENDVLYGAEVSEREKVDIPGYDFVGWSYGESGSKPETMPNKDITATGTYVAKEAEFVINYYGQNVDCGNTYTLLSEYTETKKCLHDDAITFGKDDAREITGYTVQGVVFSHGDASGSDISAVTLHDSYTGDASVVEGKKLYVNVYYKRNKHSINLNVWKGTRGVAANSVYTMTWNDIPYGYEFSSDEINTYKTYYEDNFKESYESDISKGLSGFTLAQYTDWSTGTAPTTMPDGDVTISKDYVVASDSRYYVEVYTEGTDGNYSQLANMVCYSSVGRYICYNPDSDAIDSLDNYITYNELKNNMPSLAHYQYNPKLSDPKNVDYTGDGCIDGYVTDVDVKNEEPLTLRIYFERKTVTTKINYYYANDEDSSAVKMYTVTKSGKWGTTYSIEADAYFDSNSDDRSSQASDYWSNADKGTVTDVSAGTVTINGKDVNEYDFRNNTYAVFYYEHHMKNGANQYTPKSFLWAGDFNNSDTAEFGYDSNSNYVNVYYVKVNPNKTYYVDVKYRTGGLHAISPGEDIQLTCKINDNTYKVRLANEKDVLNGTATDVTQEDNYPAGNVIRQMYSPLGSDKTPKEGYVEQTVTTKYGTDTYYIKDDYIYIVDTRNHLFYGNRSSINLGNPTNCSSGIKNAAAIGYSDIVDYLTAYKADTGNSDSAREAAYIYNNGLGSMLYSQGDSYNYIYSFAYADTYSLTFSLNGATGMNEQRYVYNHKFTLEELERFANIHFNTPIGKRIVLYEDANCTRPVGSEYTIKGNTVIYCRYEKAIYDNQYFISYELPNSVKLGNEEAYYIDKSNYESAISLGVFDASPEVVEEDIILNNEYGISLNYKKKTTKYKINGELALVLVTVPGFANSEISMTYTDYAEEGYYYDDTNSNNTSNGYCMTEGVKLSAYYTRYKYTFTLDNNNEKINNATIYTYSYGKNVELATPSKNGYTFAGWKWTFGGTDLAWSPNITSFVMPTQNLSAVAQWTPAEFTGRIVHYFQTETQTYDTSGLARILNGEDITVNACTIKMHNNFISDNQISDAKIYYENSSENSSIIGASFVYDNNVLYFATATDKQGYYEVDASDLIAMVQSMKEISESNVGVSKYIMPESSPFASIFTYTFTICSENATIERHGKTDTFNANPDMDVAYYYTRSTNNNIRAFGMATDNGAAGVTVTGAGDHYYGESVTLSAVLSSGYDFVGWYKAEDVLVRYDGENKITYQQDIQNNSVIDLSQYKLDEEYDFNSNVLSKDTSYGFKVTKPEVYVAVVSPLSMDGTSAEIICNSENITYGNISPTDDNLSLDIHLGNENVVVTGYKWYKQEGDEWKLIEDATSGVYNLDTSSKAGTYNYRCELLLKRSDNGRTTTITTEPYKVVINKANMAVVSKNYEGVYDGIKHGISIDVNKPVSPDDYTIYYSDTEIGVNTELEALSVNAEEFKQKDVKYDVENKSVLSYDVYFYIKDNTGNYNDYVGHNTIKIIPKNITVKASTKGFSYSKVYDKDTKVNGEINVVDSDKGRLANGINGNTFYTISGIVDGDISMENTTYIIDFDAEYNAPHVATATAVTLKNMKLVTVIDEQYIDNYNYSFSSSSTLTLSAYITPYPIATNWDNNTTFTYDGQYHKPSVSVGDEENIPDGIENIELNTSGEQVNVGDYYANVTIGIKDGVTDVYSSDYKAQTEKKQYSIQQRTLTITPSNEDSEIKKVYNGQNQTIDKYSVDGLVNGELVEYTPGISKKNAGTIKVKADNVKVFTTDANGNKSKDITDNYKIVCPEETLTILKRPVTVSGITAEDKVYDGNRTATLHTENAVFTGVIGDDKIHMAENCLTGTFESAAVGTYIDRVNISIAEEINVEDILGGEDANNYIVDWNSDATIKTTSASITKSEIKIKVKDVTEVYGETTQFSVEYSGFVGDDTSSVITGSPKYKVRKQGTSDAFTEYTPTMGAGTYEIAIDISGMSVGNYILVVSNPGASYNTDGLTTATLVVSKRSVCVLKNSEDAVTKTYDGTVDADKNTSLEKVKLSAIIDMAKSGVISGDVVTIGADNASYNSKNVGEAVTITISGLTLTAGGDNYVLVNNEVNINGSITPKTLTITADSQNIDYGSPAKAFSAKFDGLVNGESIAVSNLNFTCGYDTNISAQRNVGEYTIDVEYASDYVNNNYAVTFKQGKLNVNKKTVKVNGKSYEITYNLHGIPDYGLDDNEPYTGFAYGETIDTIAEKTSSGAITFACQDSLNQNVTNVSIPNVYTIQMDLKGLDSKNYTFVANPGKLTIQKHELTITGITVNRKKYDGTLHLAKISDISYDRINYGTNLRTEDGQYLRENNLVCVEVTNGTSDNVYDTKNVGKDKVVTLNVKLTGYLAERYTLTSDTVKVQNCEIYKENLTVTADGKEITYGSPSPSYTVSYEGFVTGEDKKVLGGTLTCNCSYTSTSNVGDYVITPSGYTSDNYDIKYNEGTLKVIQATMNAKAPYWDTTRPGTIMWNHADSIGSVNPDRYTLQLYKDGVAVGEKVTVNATDTLEHNFDDIIREKGEGLYTVGIVAIPSTLSNEDYKNVKEGSEVSSTATTVSNGKTLRAVKVSVVMATDATSAAGVKGVSNPVYIKESDKSEYIMLAGESNVAIGVTMKNSTGYTVKSMNVDSEATNYFTITTGNQTNQLHQSEISAKQALTESNITNVTVTVTLQPVAPTLKLDMKQINANYDEMKFAFGYTEQIAPEYQIIPSVVNDNVTTDGYTYTYTWEYRIVGGSFTDLEDNGNNIKWKTGFNANAYDIRCTVKATRNDNGLSVTAYKEMKLYISRKDLEAEVKINGWKYGEERNNPAVTFNPENGEVTYSYCKVENGDEGTYTTSIPTEAGTYKVKADIAQTTNYNAKTTTPVEFNITKAKFDVVNPDKITMEASNTAPYGLIKWEAVPTIYENAGNVATSNVAPKYAVIFAKETTETEGAEILTNIDESITNASRLKYDEKYYDVLMVKNGADCLTVCQYDFTSYIKEEGNYSCFIQAYPGKYTCVTTPVEEFGNYNAERDVNRSDLSVFSATLEFNGSLEVKHGGVSVEKASDDSVIITYDGLDTTLEMKYNVEGMAGVTYKWYKNSTLVQDSNSSIITIKNVADSGVYVCEIYINGTKSYVSPYQKVTINKRKITIKADDANKTYDGTALTKDTYTVTNTGADGGLANPEGKISDQITAITITGSRTDCGTSANKAEGAKIQVGDQNGEDVTNSYQITYVDGRLEVTKATPSLEMLTEMMDKTYDGVAVLNPAVSYLGVQVPNGIEGERTDLIANNAGASEVVFTYYKKLVGDIYTEIDAAPKNAGSYKVVVSAEEGSNYTAAASVEKTFEIRKRNITIKAADANKTYDGTALTKDTFTVTNTALDEGLANTSTKADAITAITITGSRTDCGESANKASGARIQVGDKNGEDVTDNYQIIYADGTLKVTEATATLSIITTSLDKTYDGTAAATPSVTYTGVDGESIKTADNLTFKYYQKGESGDYDIALTGAPKNAGDYKVVASAEQVANYNPVNDEELAFTISKRKITIKTADADKTYDGTALTKNEYKVMNTLPDEGLAKPEGKIADQITTITITGSQTDCGESANKASGAKIQVGDKNGEDVTDNYDIKYVDGTLKVTEATATLKITTTFLDKVYDGVVIDNPIVTYTGVGGESIKTADNVTFKYYQKGESGDYDIALTGAPKNAGDYKVVASAEQVANYNPVNDEELSFIISKRKITIKAADADNTYDGTALTKNEYKVMNTLPDEGLAKPEGKIADQITTITITGSQTDCGTSVNKASGAKIQVGDKNGEDVTDNYQINYVDGTLMVTKATPSLKILTEMMDKTYDGVAVLNPAVSYLGIQVPNGIEGERTDLINNNTGASVVVFTYYKKLADESYEVLDGAPKNAGSYKVVVSAAAGSNYNVAASVEKTFEIRKRNITIKADDANKTYDGTALTKDTFTVTNTALDEGLANAATKADAITIITITGSRTDCGESANKASGARIQVGDKNGEDVTDNYQIIYADGTLKVTEATATLRITTTSLDKTYDGTAAATPSVTYTGVDGESIKTADNVTFKYYQKGESGDYDIALTGAPKNAGDYKVVASAEQVANYNPVSDEELAFTISKRNITIKADDANKTYDGTALTKDTFTVTNTESDEGLANPEGKSADKITAITITGSQTDCGTSANRAEGAKIQVGDQNGEDVTNSYQITYVDGTLEVTKATPSLEMLTEMMDKTYDGVAVLNPAVSYLGVQVPNGIEGERTDLIANNAGASEVVFTYYKKLVGDIYTEIDESPKNAGSYKVVVSAEEGSNYTAATSVEKTFEITKRNITIKADDANKVYDGAKLEKNSYTVTNTETDEGLATPVGKQPDVITDYTITGSQTDVGKSENIVSDIVIRVGNKAGENVTDSYNITLDNGTLEVSKANSSIIITECEDKEYDGTTVVPSYKYIGDGTVTFIYMDENMQILDNPPVDQGTYYVKAVSNDSKNYFETMSETAVFKIKAVSLEQHDLTDEEQKKFDIKVGDAETYIYMGFELRPGIMVSYIGNILEEGVDYRVEYSDNINEGMANVSIMGIGNYSGTIVIPFHIIKRKVVITTESSSKNYDGTALVCDKYVVSKYFDKLNNQYMEESGLADGHTAIVKINGTQMQVGVSENAIADVRIIDGNGNDVTSNYELIYQLGTLEVRKNVEQNISEEETTTNPSTELSTEVSQGQSVEESKDLANSDADKLPLTGDSTNVWSCWILCIMSGSVIIIYRRRKREGK